VIVTPVASPSGSAGPRTSIISLFRLYHSNYTVPRPIYRVGLPASYIVRVMTLLTSRASVDFNFFFAGVSTSWDVRQGAREAAVALGGHKRGVCAVSSRAALASVSGSDLVFTGDGNGTVYAWDWRRSSGGALASARAHRGCVNAISPVSNARNGADVVASAGEDGVVRVLSLDGHLGGAIALHGHLGPVTSLATVRYGGASGDGFGTSRKNWNGDDARDAALRDAHLGATLTYSGSSGSLFGRSSGFSSGHDANEGYPGLGLVSGSVDGAVAMWSRVRTGDGSGGEWRCVGRAHAHAAAVAAVEAYVSHRDDGGGGVLTAAWDNSVAFFPRSTIDGVLGRARYGGGGIGFAADAPATRRDGRRSRAHSRSGSFGGELHRAVGGASSTLTRDRTSSFDDRGGGQSALFGDAGVGGGVHDADDALSFSSKPRTWTPSGMHRAPGRPRTIAIDPAGRRLVSGFADGRVTCAVMSAPSTA